MADSQFSAWWSYWRLAWERRPHSKTFTLWKAIAPILVGIIQFVWRYHTLKTKPGWIEMWIAIGIIIVVYLILSTVEAIRNFVIISPVNLDAEKSAKIDELNEAISRLSAVAYPAVSPTEERKRKLVAEKIKDFSHEAKKILRCIMDHGGIHENTLEGECGFIYNDINKTITEGIVCELIVPLGGGRYSISPPFQSALDYVLTSEDL